MSQVKTRPRWRRVLLLVLKVYAALCAVVVTAVLALILWAYLTPPVSVTEDQAGAKEPETNVWSWPPVDLNYDLPRVPGVEGLFRLNPEPDGLPKTGAPQTHRAANRSQPVGPETNRTSAAARGER